MKLNAGSLRYSLVLLAVLMSLTAACSSNEKERQINAADSPANTQWVGTWATAPQLTEPRNNPPEPGLEGNTLRQVFRVSLGGDTLRMRFSNEFSESPVTLKRVALATARGASNIDIASNAQLTFNGEPSVTIEPGRAVYSDALDFSVKALSQLAVTIAFGQVPEGITGHPGSRTTSYILPGDQVNALSMPQAVTTDHWYLLTGLEVRAPHSAAAIAIMGDSITDGRGSGTNQQNRWPDELANRLQANPATRQVAVLNQGIGGNCITRPCLGPAGLERFSRDVLGQQGVKWLIILEGINDLGGHGTTEKAENIISVYQDMIHRAHAAGIKVYGATLTPIKGSGYESPGSLAAVETVNHWIRHSSQFDAVIDFYQAVEDSQKPGHLKPEYDSGDGLHLSEAGYRAMAEAIELSLFKR
ncbi:SGNH/GDSL hydrolase family protein [Gilvimarinus algae]|uniref:SGNH/GDSL hydrolase family protein n=1 Tax=Gilvimarinus algae TaxID=3058037 RepID=A0ABT8TE92_9GAMM|nr:SGNH/GDSL hydrolase family protein [Gilvimarinus sp. SDUM040014]MDO3382426.1 SGNH/GDSL hydrolase family protein [Gilvimarinus sp. SDUM040014]